MLTSLAALLVLAQFSAASKTTVPLSASDKALLRRIHVALLNLSDKKAWFVKFEQAVRPNEARAAQALLPHLKPNTESYAEVAFAGAYYGLDYDTNLRRVARPCLLSDDPQQDEYEANYSKINVSRQPFFDPEQVPFELNILYLKRHDLKSLGLWLDLKTDGAVAESSDDELAGLWERHKYDMLRAACDNPERIRHLAEALSFDEIADIQNEAKEYPAVLKLAKTFRPLTQNSDTKVARGAQQLIASLRNYKNWKPE